MTASFGTTPRSPTAGVAPTFTARLTLSFRCNFCIVAYPWVSCTGRVLAGCFVLIVVHSYAIRDIAVGEELLDDYGFYEFPDWFVALQAEYGVSHAFADVKKPVS